MQYSTLITDVVDQMPEVIRNENRVAAWNELAGKAGLDASEGMDVIIAVPRDMTIRQEGRADSAWGGAWEWNLTDSATKTAVVAVLVAATLAAVGAGTGLAPIIIPTIVPLLFDLKRVRLERTADHYLRIIGARPEFAERVGTLEQLYDSLEPEVRAEITKAELLEFLGDAADAGHASESDGHFEVLPNGETAFRIRIR